MKVTWLINGGNDLNPGNLIQNLFQKLIFIGSLLEAEHCTKYLLWIRSFIPHNYSERNAINTCSLTG